MHPIQKLLLEGKKYPYICQHLNVASSTVAYHAKKLNLQTRSFVRPKYDWSEIQSYYDEGHTIADLKHRFGIDPSSVQLATRRGCFKPAKDTQERRNLLAKTRRKEGRSRNCFSDEEIFIENSLVPQSTLRRRLRQGDVIPSGCANKDCSLFGIENPVWASKPLVLQVEHKNGKRNDNRKENLEWRCPNCHSQTETYCGRNKSPKLS